MLRGFIINISMLTLAVMSSPRSDVVSPSICSYICSYVPFFFLRRWAKGRCFAESKKVSLSSMSILIKFLIGLECMLGFGEYDDCLSAIG